MIIEKEEANIDMKNTTGKIDKQQMIELEKQIHNLENCIGILQHKLQSKQKVLKQLQNHQNLVNLLYYNILSKEKDVSKIQESFNKLIANANLVIKKLPLDIKTKVKSPTLCFPNLTAPVIKEKRATPKPISVKTVSTNSRAPRKSLKQTHFQQWLAENTQKTLKKSNFSSYEIFYNSYLSYLEQKNLSSHALTPSGFTKALGQDSIRIDIVVLGKIKMVKAQIK